MTLGYVCCFGLMPLKLALAGLYLFICFFADVLRAVFWLLTVGCCLQKCWFIGPCRGKRRHRDCCERRAKCCTLYPVALNPTEVVGNWVWNFALVGDCFCIRLFTQCVMRQQKELIMEARPLIIRPLSANKSISRFFFSFEKLERRRVSKSQKEFCLKN